MKKINITLLSLAGLLIAGSANAFCPVCTVAVGLGVELSHYLGIDDTISGVWIGGLIIALIMWFVDWLNKRGINFKFREAIITIAFYALVIVPLYFTGVINQPLNKIWNIDKLVFGIIAGSLVFVIGVGIDNLISKDNEGKQYFPLQKVAITLLMLLFMSLVFYLIVY